jgi:arsenate reductase (thioredoxin)
MAEGLARKFHSRFIEFQSAGIEKHGLNPMAVRVMAEVGVDISSYRSKTLQELSGIQFDYVFTVCSHAHESCPVFPHDAQIIHQGFDDPPKLAQGIKDEEKALDHYRRVRDEINEFARNLSEFLNL